MTRAVGPAGSHTRKGAANQDDVRPCARRGWAHGPRGTTVLTPVGHRSDSPLGSAGVFTTGPKLP